MTTRNLSRLEPLWNLPVLQGDFDRWFNDWLRPNWQANAEASFKPSCDVAETPTHYSLTFDLPGVNKDDINIELKDSMLTVSGERRVEKSQDDEKNHVTERYYGSFQRVFQLPNDVDADKIEAQYQDGVLRLAIPKTEKAKPRKVEIKGGDTKGKLSSHSGSKAA